MRESVQVYLLLQVLPPIALERAQSTDKHLSVLSAR